MPQLASREDLKNYGLRKLGAPVTTVNLDNTQIEDAVEDALEFLQEYHYDFTERDYIAIQITQQHIDDGRIILSEDIREVLSISNYTNNSGSTDALFSVKYQLRLNDLFNISSQTMQYYMMSRQYISLLDDILNPELRYEFNRYTRKLDIFFNWRTEASIGNYLIVEVNRTLDIETYTGLWNHWVLRDVFTEMLRLRWGDVLIKFGAMELPGGVTLEGGTIMNEAKERLEELKRDFRTKYSEPTDFIIA